VAGGPEDERPDAAVAPSGLGGPSALSVVHGKLKRFVLGERRTIAGTVYGTIIVLSVLSVGARSFEHRLWQLDALVAVSAIVLWVAHVYSHGLGESLSRGRRLTLAELREIARREYAIILAATLPVAAITLGAIGLVDDHAAVRAAFGLGIITLAAQGVRYARLEQLSRVGTIVTVSVNLALGLTIVAMEVFVAH
jgi:hypothetical protein